MNKRILLLRTFRDSIEDFLDIALLANVCGEFGKLIIAGEKSGNLELQKSLISTNLIGSSEIHQHVEFVDASADTWRRIIIEQILCADALIVRFTPKSFSFPELVTPHPVNSYVEYYQIAPQDRQTGAGLLSELAYCNRLDALKKCLLLVNEWQANDLGRILKLVSLGPGDIFKFGGVGMSMVPQRPRFTALDFQIASLQDVNSALALPRRDVLFSNIGYINAAIVELNKRITAILDANHPKQSADERAKQGFLDWGVSDNPKKVFPDYDLKVIRYTPVEKLLAMSGGQLVEIDFETVIRDYALEPRNAICPYCKARKDYLFFYQYGHTVSTQDLVRCKCQFCSRRSTLDSGILMDQ